LIAYITATTLKPGYLGTAHQSTL